MSAYTQSHDSIDTVTLRNLVVLNYANGFTMYHYRPSKDQDLLRVTSQEFWADAHWINAGDIIEVSNDKFAIRLFKSRDGIEAI